MHYFNKAMLTALLITLFLRPVITRGQSSAKGGMFNAFGGMSKSGNFYIIDQGGSWVSRESGEAGTVRSLFFQLVSTRSPQTDVGSYQGPLNYNLSRNFPNPFNPCTTIRFTVPKTAHVSLDIYDARGRQVIRVLNKTMTAGEYTLNLDFQRLPSGIYYCRMTADGFRAVSKMIFMK